MRAVIEIILAAAIIALAWEKPLGERFQPKPPPPPEKIVTQPLPRPTPGAWMYDPNRHTRLDAGSDKAMFPNKSTNGSWMWDPNHKSPLDLPRKGSSATPREH